MRSEYSLGRYQILRALAAPSKHLAYKVREGSRNYRITAAPLAMAACPTPHEMARLQQLLQKCRKYRQLDHPHVETIFDVFHFQEEEVNYLAIVGEYSCEGDLDDFIQDPSSRSSPELKDIMVGLCDALEYLHSRAITHSAITPETIRRIGGSFKLTFPSFREVHWFNSRQQSARQQPGKQEADEQGLARRARSLAGFYISPELREGVRFSQATDVWSLGVVFYQMLSGRQFRLVSRQMPCEMGSLGEQALREVPSAMMRSLLKEMLVADSSARIGIGRARNILANSDIFSQDPDFEEDIIQEVSSRTLALPLFALARPPPSPACRPPSATRATPTEGRHLHLSFGNLTVALVYKPATCALEVSVGCEEASISVMAEYLFQELPLAFGEVFGSTVEVFEEVRSESMAVGGVSSSGELLLTLGSSRFASLAAKRASTRSQSNNTSTRDNSDEKSRNIDSLQRLLSLQMKREKGLKDDSMSAVMKKMGLQPKISFLYSQKQQVDYSQNQRRLQFLMQAQFPTQLSLVYQVSEHVSELQILQQNYSQCLEFNQKVLKYLVDLNAGSWIAFPLSRLLFCAEIISDEQQLARWQSYLMQDAKEYSLLCHILSAVNFYCEAMRFSQNGRVEESNVMFERMNMRLDLILIENQSIILTPEHVLEHLLTAIFTIYTNHCIHLYIIGSKLLTKIYNQIKDSKQSLHQKLCSYIAESTADLIRKSVFAPKMKIVLKEWIRANMPERYTSYPADDYY